MSLPISSSDAVFFVPFAFGLQVLLLSRLYRIIIKFALLFFLFLLFLRKFLLTLLKTKVRFPQGVPPDEEMYEIIQVLMRARRTRYHPAALALLYPISVISFLLFLVGLLDAADSLRCRFPASALNWLDVSA